MCIPYLFTYCNHARKKKVRIKTNANISSSEMFKIIGKILVNSARTAFLKLVYSMS